MTVPTILRFSIVALAIIVVSHRAESTDSTDDVLPEQIRLSYGGCPTEMIVTWTTMSAIPINASNAVDYGVSSSALTNIRNAQTTVFVDPGPSHIVRYIHRATMTDLQPEIRYFYHVGGSAGLSKVFWFRALPSSADHHMRVGIFGDFGIENGVSFPYLEAAVLRGDFDMIIHVGDIAYDLWTDDGRSADVFFRQLEPIAAYVPYMVIAGNHEENYHYSHYENLFTMPNWMNTRNHYYSFDLGAVHFAGFSSELYAFAKNDTDVQQALAEYNWLQQDLTESLLGEWTGGLTRPGLNVRKFQAANDRRAQTPWLIFFMHRPIYCSDILTNNCTDDDNKLLRVGDRRLPGLEPLLVSQRLDLVFTGHMHFYERLWPVENEQVFNNATDPYHNSPAPIYIVSGLAGPHDRDSFSSQPTPWSAFRAVEYGYSVLHIYNATHLGLEQISVERNGSVIDSAVISKDALNRESLVDKKGSLTRRRLLQKGDSYKKAALTRRRLI